MGLFGFGKKKKAIQKENIYNESFEENLIRYLNDNGYNHGEVRLLLPEVVNVLNFESKWKSILSLEKRNERVEKTIYYWEKYASSFEIMIKILKSMLFSIDTVLYNEQLKVIYTFRVKDGFLYYIGGLPIEYPQDAIVNQLPIEILDFYRNIHNGFVLYGLGDMGLESYDNFYCIGEDLLQEEFIDGYSVKDTYMIFSNGAGDGIVYDVSQTPVKGFLYFHDDHDGCEFDINLIDTMCAWIEIVLKDI